MPRLLIISNRLPITVRVARGDFAIVPSTGGLVGAMREPHDRLDALWIGWPGDVSDLSETARKRLKDELSARRVLPVEISREDISSYYDRLSNGVLWPLFHYLVDRVSLGTQKDWERYQVVNERFAEMTAKHYRTGDAVWVHDYQLMLVPELLRRKLPDAKIGFFLHIPFPSVEVLRIFPFRECLLHGLLGADVVGFHTAGYKNHFIHALSEVLGLKPRVDRIDYGGRSVRARAYPISIDAPAFGRMASSPELAIESARIREQAQGRRVVLSIDRLDYTKGILARLSAIERLLERDAGLRETTRFIQLAVPTRENLEAYGEVRQQVNEAVGRINAQYGSVDALPIHLLYRSLPVEEVVALYLAADAMVVTPLRDGMNLVAKEFIATRLDGTGVLVLSEFCGASSELSEAICVNPYDIDGLAAGIKRALEMSIEEQRMRMGKLRRRVAAHDVHRWADSFLSDLEGPGVRIRAARKPAPDDAVEELANRARHAPELVLILDYDGTLVPLAPSPSLANPDAELLDLLSALAARPKTRVHVVSGRRREDLEAWLGVLPIGLHAEHGTSSRARPGDEWIAEASPDTRWKPRVLELFQAACSRTPGARIEEKPISVAFHYRTASQRLASRAVREIERALVDVLPEYDLELMRGSKAIEVRPRGMSKALAVHRIRRGLDPSALILAAGDDATDEDLFAALPPEALTVHVGRTRSIASERLKDVAALRRLLRAILAKTPAGPP